MRSNFKKHALYTKEEMQKYIDEAWELHRQEEFENCKRDIIAQLMSACCMGLHHSFGFGRERLKRIKEAVEDELKFESFGKKSTTQDCIDTVKSKFGIDFDSKGDSKNGK